MSASLLTKKYQRGTLRWKGRDSGLVREVEGEFRLNDNNEVLCKYDVVGYRSMGHRECHIQRVLWFDRTPQERP